jgi:hypothetical protein
MADLLNVQFSRPKVYPDNGRSNAYGRDPSGPSTGAAPPIGGRPPALLLARRINPFSAQLNEILGSEEKPLARSSIH